eukprot:1239174-Alexandrium_andersonii.AAC.1
MAGGEGERRRNSWLHPARNQNAAGRGGNPRQREACGARNHRRLRACGSRLAAQAKAQPSQ